MRCGGLNCRSTAVAAAAKGDVIAGVGLHTGARCGGAGQAVSVAQQILTLVVGQLQLTQRV